MHRWWEVYLRILLGSWRMLIFMLGFVLVMWAVSHFFLVEAMERYRTGTPEQRSQLRAISGLLMAIMLSMLAVGTWWAAKRRR